MSHSLILNCWVLRDDPSKVFEVAIESSASVGALKTYIQHAVFATYPANSLRLWMVSCATLKIWRIYRDNSIFWKADINLTTDSDLLKQIEVEGDNDIPKATQLTEPWVPLSELFKDRAKAQHLHIIVQSPPGTCRSPPEFVVLWRIPARRTSKTNRSSPWYKTPFTSPTGVCLLIIWCRLQSQSVLATMRMTMGMGRKRCHQKFPARFSGPALDAPFWLRLLVTKLSMLWKRRSRSKIKTDSTTSMLLTLTFGKWVNPPRPLLVAMTNNIFAARDSLFRESHWWTAQGSQWSCENSRGCRKARNHEEAVKLFLWPSSRKLHSFGCASSPFWWVPTNRLASIGTLTFISWSNIASIAPTFHRWLSRLQGDNWKTCRGRQSKEVSFHWSQPLCISSYSS